MDSNLLWVLLGSLSTGAAAALIGCLAFINQRSLIGDALAHCALPGVLCAFLLAGTNDIDIMFLGGAVSAAVGYWLIEMLIQKHNIAPDSALAIILSLFFSIGVFILSIIQRLPLQGKSSLEHVFFGQAAAILPEDLMRLIGIFIIALLVIGIHFFSFRALAFDRKFSVVSGLNVKYYDVLLGMLMVSVVVIGLQVIGIILMSASLIIPVIIALKWTSHLPTALMNALLANCISVAIGVMISLNNDHFPTGPWIVVVLAFLFLLSAFFSPHKGLITQQYRRRKHQNALLQENFLRACFLIYEAGLQHFPISHLLTVKTFPHSKLQKLANTLKKKQLITFDNNTLSLTENGLSLATALTRKHRLWEQYLNENTGLGKDQLHSSADEAEHVITKDLLERIEQTLQQTHTDPHGKSIP